MSQETDRVFSGIPAGNGNYRGMSSVYNPDGTLKRYDQVKKQWVPMSGLPTSGAKGGRGKSRRSTRASRHLKKHKRVHHTRRKQSRRHRHSRSRHH